VLEVLAFAPTMNAVEDYHKEIYNSMQTVKMEVQIVSMELDVNSVSIPLQMKKIPTICLNVVQLLLSASQRNAVMLYKIQIHQLVKDIYNSMKTV